MRFINVAVTNWNLAISISCQTKNFKSHHLIKEVVKRKETIAISLPSIIIIIVDEQH